MIVKEILRSPSGCLIIKGPPGAGKNTLVKHIVERYADAARAVVGVHESGDIGIGCEPLIDCLADLIYNLTAIPGKDLGKRRKVLVASTRKIKRGEREATILLLKELHRLVRDRCGEDFDADYYTFLEIVPKDEDGTLLTLPELATFLKENLQVFINSYVHLVENLAGFMARMKLKAIFHFRRAQQIQNMALAYIADFASRIPDNVYFFFSFDEGKGESAWEKIGYLSSLSSSKMMVLEGLGIPGIAKMMAAKRGEKPGKKEVLKIREMTDGSPFYLTVLLEREKGSMEAEGDAGEEFGRHLRCEMKELGEDFTGFMELWSLSRRRLTGEDLSVLSSIGGSRIASIQETARAKGYLDEENRFMHPLIREHIAQSMEEGGRKALHGKLGTYYEELLKAGADEADKYDFKLVWSISFHYFNSSEREKSYSFNTFMAREGMLSGNLDIASIGYERALSDAVMMKNDAYRISVLEKLVKVLETEHRWDRALEIHSMLVDHFSSLGDVENKCIALQRIAAIYQFKGDFEGALGHYERVLKTYRKEEDATKIMGALSNIGTLYQIKEDFEDAIRTYEEALGISVEAGEEKVQAALHHKIASVYHMDFKYTKALGHYNTSQKLFKKVGDDAGYGEALRQMGNIHYLKEKLPSAGRYYEKALGILEGTGARKSVAEIQYQMGMIAGNEKNYQKALDHLNGALDLFREIKDMGSVSNTIRTMGDTYLDIARKQISEEKFVLAKETLGGAVKIYAQVRDREGTDEANYLLEDISDIESGRKTRSEVTSCWK